VLLEAERVAVDLDGSTLLPETTLRVQPGECVAVLGANGAGKTTLLRVLAGRLPPSSGRVHLSGAPLRERDTRVRRAIAALIDPPTLYPDLTLRENLALIEAAWSGDHPSLGIAALDVFGLQDLALRFANELSSGQRQLASLAVTFARPAHILLLDEPEQRLDPDRRSLLAQAMRTARSRGVAVVFASHAPDLVDQVADRAVRISP